MECVPDNPGMESDARLLEQFRSTSDPRILDDLLGRYLGPLRNLMYQMVGNEADADDLTQDALVKAYRGLHRFEGRSAFSTWIYRIAMNTARTFLRRRQRLQPGPLEPHSEPPAPRQSHPDWHVTSRELDESLRQALDCLAPEQRAALVLTVIQGLPAREAAHIENCPAATIYWRVYRARRELRKHLAEFLDG